VVNDSGRAKNLPQLDVEGDNATAVAQTGALPRITQNLKGETIAPESSITLSSVQPSKVTKIVDNYINYALEHANEDLMSNVTDNMPEPFDIRKNGERWTLSLPGNINEYDRFLMRQIISMSSKLKVELVSTTQTIVLAKEVPSEKDFFYGFFKLLSRSPMDNEKFSFSNDSISARGAAQAKLIIMQRSLGSEYSDVQNFLPSFLFTEKGGKRIEMEINALATGQKSNIQKLSICISRLVSLWLETEMGKHWCVLAKSFEVPSSAVLEGLHRTKVVKEKGKDKILIKKPKRPSKRIEVLSLEEANILSFIEKPFDDYSEFIKSLGESIAINKIVETRKKVKSIIAAMWIVVEKVSAPLTKRRTAFLAHLSESERKKQNINKAFIESLKSEFFSPIKEDNNLFYTISPIPLLLKAVNKELVVEVSKIEISIHYIVIPQGTNPLISNVVQTFANQTGIRVHDVRPSFKPKKKRATQVDQFSDEENIPEDTTQGDLF